MKIREIIIDWLIYTRLFEIAFERKHVIDQLSNSQYQININALKIIVWPNAQEVPDWKRELRAKGNALAGMWLLRGRRSPPMGFDLAWKHLYLEPFEYVEDQALTSRLQFIQREHQRPITKQPVQIMAEYMAFIRPFCQAIGQGQFVDSVVDALGQSAPPPMQRNDAATPA